MVRLEVLVPAGWSLVAGKKELRATLRKAGAEVAARARALIRAKAAGGKVRASVPGEPPVSRTGVLARSFKVRPWRNGEGVTVRDAVYYALFLEAGSQGGGGASRGAGNILFAGERNARGRVLRRHNRLKRTAVSITRMQAPRPFLTRALDEVASQSLGERVVGALVAGIEFKRAQQPWSLLK